MTIGKRSAVVGIMAVASLILFGTAKLNSHILVEYVVERALIQKAPAGTDPVEIRRRLQMLLDSAGDRNSGMEILFGISRELEKVQALTPQALAGIMKEEAPAAIDD